MRHKADRRSAGFAMKAVRRKVDWKLAGFAMVVVVGVAIVTWTHIQDPDPAGIGRTLIIVGALGAVFAKLDAKTERSTEDFNEGYEKGMDAGYKMAQEEGVKAKPERPVLVDAADRFERNHNSAPVSSSLRRTSRRSDEE